jgi:hypothetical protein
MNARIFARNAPALAARQLVTPRTIQPSGVAKRFASSEAIGPELVKERDHHKDHAASESLSHAQLPQRTTRILTMNTHPLFALAESADMWRKVSIYVCVPLCE